MTPAVAVLSLTRDRLDYTRHCFAKLHEHAGIEFDHFVLDQGSDDGSGEWLDSYEPTVLIEERENIGVCRALNKLLDVAFEIDDYDVIVKFDNDCELTQQDTLRDVVDLVMEGGCILSPRILGLRNTPRPMRELVIGNEPILDIPQIGGIFMAVPAWVYDEFRYDETSPLYGLDDVALCAWYRREGGTCGYVKRLEAWHYETTDGQHDRYPDYFQRKQEEMAAA